jgi:hypothetical protein
MIRDLIVAIDPDRGEIYEFLMMGFDARYDLEVSRDV